MSAVRTSTSYRVFTVINMLFLLGIVILVVVKPF